MTSLKSTTKRSLKVVNKTITSQQQRKKIKTEPAEVSIKVETVKKEHIKIEIENEEIVSSPNIFPKAEPTASSIKAPENWVKIYNEIVDMRSKFMAPVDTQGCERMPNTIDPGIKTRDPKIYRFQLLISLMLSSQTKDEVNFDAMTKLHQGMQKRGFTNGLCIDAVLSLSEKEIDEYINKVGFHNRKSQYIKNACEILKQKHNGDIPKTIEEIVELPGVGPKMGYLLLQCGWGINGGIGVDVHLHRLALMWHWVSAKANTPEKARIELESWLPEQYWTPVNPLIVGFGQVVCVPRASNCDVCTLGTKGLCKAANKKLVKGPITEARLLKLRKQRADLTKLINDVI
ncbi:NTH1 [[Candida] subhashii]|uniref:Endonuclease III homolog n=1 Tax=[Candida] subhashii TaxID=561895 RepID=A0A8J5Q611_9ASCO|nr:NTH1 [[Candida] subhashii]KAG7662009.1 NTH1 [[Candida] subhashii]